ncbi:uncharacterized protein LOC112574895 isoform X1 [Pomacea canaliculata]|uniref:uncharacterized protein LOC112574895 isoform X1 n=1 Tax=Pomacea canaliculata TaxID=400727 RepID=UPI000D726FCF|nr:uncharacterized protein LOC112574895 isoform X1 [Pomacea canaliculata]
MHPSKKKGWDPHLGSELSQAWSQLDKTRKELRRMEHRVGDLGEGVPTTNHSAYLRPTGTVVCTTSEVERSQSEHSLPLNARREPLARSVDTGVRPSRPPQSHGAKRKISRLDKHATEPRGKIGSGTSRRQQRPKDGAPRKQQCRRAQRGKELPHFR